MSINVSATGLADFLKCSMKTYYRVNHPDLGESSDAMALGTIVHNTIESSYDNKEEAELRIKLAIGACNYQDPSVMFESAMMYMDNFYTLNANSLLVNAESTQELSFRLPIDKTSNFVGRIDCITGNSVFDWKTGSTRKRQLENDIQCILYAHVVERMYGIKPQVYMVYLKDLKIIKYNENTQFKRILFEEVVPSYIKAVKNREYVREGVFSGACTMCNFISSCLGE